MLDIKSHGLPSNIRRSTGTIGKKVAAIPSNVLISILTFFLMMPSIEILTVDMLTINLLF